MRIIDVPEAEFDLTQEPQYRAAERHWDDHFNMVEAMGHYQPLEREEVLRWVEDQRRFYMEESAKAVSLWRAYGPTPADEWRIVRFKFRLDHPDEEEVTVIANDKLKAFLVEMTSVGGAGADDLILFRCARSNRLGLSFYTRSGPATVWARLQGYSVEMIP